MKNSILLLIVLFVCVSGIVLADTFGTGGNAFTIDFVTISGDTNPTSGYGIVNNNYRMGKYEITNDQWNKFHAEYGTVYGSPTYAYSNDPYWNGTNVPTNMVSWYEAAQFVNYLNTSTGHQAAYKFTGTQGTSNYMFGIWSIAEAAGGTNLYRHKDAYYFLPTEDEWVKAAYWNGTSLQTYANASSGDLVLGLPDPAKWNYLASAGSEPWNVTSGINELNGTYNMMGNVWEHIESPYSSGNYLSDFNTVLRGGSYSHQPGDDALASSYRYYSYTDNEYDNVGFRVASIPEPCTLSLLAIGGLLLRKRK
jgi:formylglycine-generating enzyme required for sulfatase activity